MVKNVVSYLYLSDPNNVEDSLGVNLKYIKEYYHIFDGVKIIYISTDIDLDESLKLKIENNIGHPIYKFVKNHPTNRESEYFIDQLKSLKSEMTPKSITFYHHSKGSTYKNPNVEKWTSSMYYFNLRDESIQILEKNLGSEVIFAGIFRVDHPCPPWVYSDWHFSGTFFWFSSGLFNINNWDVHNIDRFSTESYPGHKATIDKSINIENISNEGCDLRYNYYWKNIFPMNKNYDNFNQNTKDLQKEEYKKDISEKESAWNGHFDFAIDLTKVISPKIIVELGVDWGFSMFSFAYPKIGEVYGIDWFQGDPHAGLRDTKQYVLDLYTKLKNKYKINVNIIKGDFTDISTIWAKKIDILHIDGFHSYESVSQDFYNWSKFVNDSGVVLFHDVEIFEGVNRFFSQLEGFKLIKNGSCGLGIWTLNKDIYEKIKTII